MTLGCSSSSDGADLQQQQQQVVGKRSWDINDSKLPLPDFPEPFQLWPNGHCRFAYSEESDEAKRHTSGWAMRNTNNHNVSILKKSCLGVLVCSRGCLGSRGAPLALRPAICDKARKKQCGKPCPNVKCDGLLTLQACRGHSGYPVTHFWRHLNGCVYFQAKGAHDHAAPDLKPDEQIRKRMRMFKRAGDASEEQRLQAVKKADRPKAKNKRESGAASASAMQHHHHGHQLHHQPQQQQPQQQQQICPYHSVDISQCRCGASSPCRQASAVVSHRQQHQPGPIEATAAAAAAAALLGVHEAHGGHAQPGHHQYRNILHYPLYSSQTPQYSTGVLEHHQLHHQIQQQQLQQLHHYQQQQQLLSDSPPTIDPVTDFADPFFAFWQSGGGGSSGGSSGGVYNPDGDSLAELKPHRTRQQFQLEDETPAHIQHLQLHQQQQHQQQQLQHDTLLGGAPSGSAFLPFVSSGGVSETSNSAYLQGPQGFCGRASSSAFVS